MKSRYLVFAGTVLSATPAFALDFCKPSELDPLVRICSYNPQQRYVVTGVVGYPVNLQFGNDEHIKRSDFAYTGADKAGAPSETWRGPQIKKGEDGAPIAVERFKTNLPIWPFQEGHSSLVVVTQTTEGAERAYKFDLTARKPGDCVTSKTDPGCPEDIITTAELSFTYDVVKSAEKAAEAVKVNAEKKQAAIVAWRAEQEKKKEAEAIARLKQDIFYGVRNWSYQAKSDPKYKFLAPSEVSDNGWLTEFQWPENVQQPTITIVDPVTGDERSVFPQAQGHMQIVNTTAEWFRLRLGQEAVMDIHNLKWSAERPDPQTGTTSPDVLRQVMYKDGGK
jgi:type IV secretory pathway VirB9-like protein